MIDWLKDPWPWYVAGPLIGLMVPALLIVGNRMFGISSNLRTVCAITLPRRIQFFRYDWRKVGGWNLVFALGILIGGVLVGLMTDPSTEIAISASTVADLKALGVTDFSGFVPQEIFSWDTLFSLPGIVSLVAGGFLVGFGSSYAGGCTSGHAIAGLADFQLPSLVAVLGFFAGGLLVTHLILPWLLSGVGG